MKIHADMELLFGCLCMSSGIHVNGKLCVTMTNNLHDEDYSSTEL